MMLLLRALRITPVALAAMLSASNAALAQRAAAGAEAAPQGQAYPHKPIRFVVPYSVGGATDIVSRILAQRMGDSMGQQVIVDNRPSAGAIVGMELVANATPDGYTILMSNIALGANTSLYSKLPYDAEKSFAPVSLVAQLPILLLAHPSLPVKSVAELVALSKSRPGGFNYASAGSGSANHLAMELLKSVTGLNAVHIPYKGGGPALVDLVAGQVSLLCVTIPPALQLVKSGRVVGLGVSSAKRVAALPEVPTIAESGVPGFEVYEWQGVVAPAGTPAAIIRRLNAEIVAALQIADVKERISGLGAEVVGSSPEQFAAHIKAELARWSRVLKAAGIRAD
jgi:tripartite-type tricarboxylate transporter receptor subunit TctC